MLERGPIPGAPNNRILLALGFALAHPAVDTAIVGTQNPAHMQANIDWVKNELPLAAETVTALRERFEAVGQGWVQLR
jgi:aryl-alcohol dehydrogenase-like predicted oxidoreductase